MNKNVWRTLDLYLCMQRSLVPVPKRSGILQRKVHKESGKISRKRCCWNSQNADVRFSVLRPHCAEVNSEAKDMGKLSIHFAATQETIEAIFRVIVSANQLSLYGAVAEMCEYESLHDRSERPDVVMGQSIVHSEIKTEVHVENDDPANQNFLLQQYEERIERLSQQDRMSEFCMDAGFLSVVEIGKYFMTEDTRDLTQLHAVACREYTLPREDGSSQPR